MSVKITVTFDSEADASYALMFMDRCGFTEFFDRTEPHLGKEAQTERAYRMRDAIGRIEKALRDAEIPSRIY